MTAMNSSSSDNPSNFDENNSNGYDDDMRNEANQTFPDE